MSEVRAERLEPVKIAYACTRTEPARKLNARCAPGTGRRKPARNYKYNDMKQIKGAGGQSHARAAGPQNRRFPGHQESVSSLNLHRMDAMGSSHPGLTLSVSNCGRKLNGRHDFEPIASS